MHKKSGEQVCLLRAAENGGGGGCKETQFFKIKIKKNLTHIDMMSHLIPNSSRFYRPKLHQSVVLQTLKVRAHNWLSTTAQVSFHGTEISVFKFPTLINPGTCRELLIMERTIDNHSD